MKDKKEYSILLFLLMASTTALAILAELAPSGILLQMTQDLNIKTSKAGLMVGFYAFSSAIFTIPLMYRTLKINRKKLLQILLLVFVLSNLAIGLIKSYPIILACRVIGGAAAGLLWPMISAYGSRLVSEREAGKVIALIMSGGTVGLVVGIPIITYIGYTFGWRSVYFTISIMASITLILSSIFLPSVSGEKDTSHQAIGVLLKNKNMKVVLLLTFLPITAYYSAYVYIAPLLEFLGYTGQITTAQLIFGVASFLSIFIAMRLVENHLYKLMLVNIGTGVVAMLIFTFFKGNQGLLSIGLFLWGFGYGSLSSLSQATVVRRIPWGRDMGNALQSSGFNMSIMFGAAIGGWVLDLFSIQILITLALVLFILSMVVLAKEEKVFEP